MPIRLAPTAIAESMAAVSNVQPMYVANEPTPTAGTRGRHRLG